MGAIIVLHLKRKVGNGIITIIFNDSRLCADRFRMMMSV